MGNAIGVLAIIAASSLIVQKVIEFLRKAFDPQDRVNTFWWNVAAFVIGVAYCVGWGINLAVAVQHLVPVLEESNRLSGTSGEILTGLAIGAASGFWHAAFELLEQTAKAQKAKASG